MTAPFEISRASFGQEGLWFLEALAPGQAAYHVPLFMRLRGPLQRDALAASLGDVVARHEALRTSFALEDGRLVQHIHAAADLALELEELPALAAGEQERVLAARLRDLVRRPFDASRAPLLRAALIRLGDDDLVLALVAHHLVWDGASEGIVLRELAAAYAARRSGQAPALEPPGLQLADVAAWQREAFDSGALDAQRAYWRQQLADAPAALAAPADFARSAGARGRGARVTADLPADVCAAARTLGDAEGATLLMIALAVYADVLRRFTRQRDLVIGLPTENRQRAGAAGVVGFLANMLPIRVAIAPRVSLRALVREVRARLCDAIDHQDLPFEKIVEDVGGARDAAAHPIFQTALVPFDEGARLGELAGLAIEPVAFVPETAKLDLALTLARRRDGWSISLEYDVDLFRRETAEALVACFQTVLGGALERPDAPLEDLGHADHQLDRAALPAPAAPAPVPAPDDLCEPTATPLEQLICETWAAVLGQDRVLRTDDFFELGGNSLLAMQVIARLREAFSIDVSVRALFEAPTARGFARAIASAREAGAGGAPPLSVVSRAEPLPLSYAQERLWFIHQLAPDSAAYNIAVATRFAGRLDLEALRASFRWLVARHEPLRTRFVEVGDQPRQRIDAERWIEIPLIDISGAADGESRARELATAEASTAFDLATDPMLRVRIVRLGLEDHVVLVTVHHIAADGWGMKVLIRELEVAYRAFAAGAPPRLPHLALQYADFAVWQRAWLTGAVRDEQLAYWRGQLAGMPATLGLPTDFARPAIQRFCGEHFWMPLLDDTAPLRALCREQGVTTFIALLSAFQALLARYTGATDIVVGTPSAGRVRTETEPLVGFFVNTLVLRTDLAGDPSFVEIVARVRRTALGAYQHADLPFEVVVESLAPKRDAALATPLFEVLFHVRDQAAEQLAIALPGTAAVRLDIESGTAQLDLAIDIEEVDGRLALRADYNTDLFRGDSVRRMMEHLRALLEAALAAPEARLSQLPLLSPGERALALGAWALGPVLAEAPCCVHAWFARTAAQYPDAIAVIEEAASLTYSELADRARLVSAALAGAGVGPDHRVGLCVPRSAAFVQGMLGILGAGGAFVPADPTGPLPRVLAVLRDAAVTAIVTTAEHARSLAEIGAPIVCIDAPTSAPAPSSASAAPRVALDQLAYLTYTSGSTGAPKGVMITHRGLWTRLAGGLHALPIVRGDVVLQAAAVSFDVSIWECFAALVTGARLVIVRPSGATDPDYMRALLVAHEVSIATLGPSLLSVLLEAGVFTGNAWLRDLSSGGEVFPVELVQRLHAELPRARISNHYGATEASIDTTVWTAARGERLRSVPIGRPMGDAQVYVLDRGLAPVPVGVAGELYLGGGGLARGYHGQPALTAAAFVPDPFSGAPGGRLYRTGDLGRYRRDGSLEFIGRDDLQVKVRGVRVELGEIEAAVRAHPGVRDAVVLASGEDPRAPMLVAFVVAGDPALAIPALRAFVAERLPREMQPHALILLDELPHTPHAKVDRAALAALVGEVEAPTDFVAPSTPTEQRLAGLWQQLLGAARISARASFFDLGGHSLLGTQLVSRVRRTFHVDLKLAALFEAPVLAQLAARIDELRAADRAWQRAPIERLARDRELPLSFAQQRLWFLDQLMGTSASYNVTGALRAAGRLDVAALERALTEVVRRHESLRTCFHAVDGRPVQVVQPPRPIALPIEDLGALPPEARAHAVAARGAAEARRPFDLSRDLMFRGQLLRLGAEDHIFLLSMHHIASDGWSIWILFRELAELYDAYTTHRSPRLRELPIQYADFAHWQRALLHGEAIDAELGYWREQLGGPLSPVTFPTDYRRPELETFAGRIHRFAIPRDLTAAIAQLAATEGATPFMTLLAAFDVLLAQHAGVTDVLVGSPIANRNHGDVEGLIGFFVNTLVLRTDLSGDPSFREVIARVRRTCLGAYAHEDVPFETIVDAVQPERDPSRNPIFQVMFALQNAPWVDLVLNGLEVAPVPLELETAKFDLWVSLEERGGQLFGAAEYNVDLYRGETIAALVAQYVELLRRAVAQPELPLSRLVARADGAVPAASRGPVVAEDGPLVVEQIEAAVARTPEAIALCFEGREVTYRELDARADRLARRLQRMGVGPEAVVALLLERSVELVVGVLAVLRAGGAYLPLDPDAPAARNAFMVGDAGAVAVLTQERLASAVGPVACPIVAIDRERGPGARDDDDRGLARVRAAITPDSLAYVIYTSGSTGTPKGVMSIHRGLRNRLAWMQRAYRLTAADRVLHKTPYTFDVSVWELLWPLTEGAAMVIARPDGHRDAAYLAELVLRERVTVLHFVPSMFGAFLDQARAAPRLIISSGEALPAELAQRALDQWPETALHNLYGPTEASIDVTAWPCASGRDRAVPIGRPIDNTQIYILDDELAPVPAGVRGDLYIAGVQVARGYVARPALTAERFVPDPFHPEPGRRMYRSGDLARFRSDGAIEYLGRVDDQVKLRGQRIELGEIEAALRGHPEVGEAVAVVRAPAGAEPQLVAYIVPTEAADAPGDAPAPADDAWRTAFDETYARSDGGGAADFNTLGWISSYTGERIADAEMREWVDATVARIRALAPRSILEIGCGTGLLVARLLPLVDRYVAVDVSPQALAAAARAVAGRPEAARLELLERAADDLADLPAGGVDIVVLSSVVQYFPDAEYARRVVAQAVAATRADGAIFIGDVRDLGLLRAFHASIELAHAPRTMPGAELRERVRHRTFTEPELALDPRFFTACAAALPRIAAVRAQRKATRHPNEMTCARYDVTLHLDRAPAHAAESVGWEAQAWTPDALSAYLAARDPDALEVRGIPDARVAAWLSVVDELDGGAARHAGALRATAAGGVDPMDLVDRAAALGYDLELAWSPARGRFDALATRHGLAAAPVTRPVASDDPDIAAWADQPARARAARRLPPALRAHLKQRLPAWMVPSAYVVLEALPRTTSGKVDRKALPAPSRARPELATSWAPPRGPAEEVLAGIWAELLGLHRVGIHDNFFDLGGDSILSIQVVARANRAGLQLKPRHLFQHSTIAGCAAIAIANADAADAAPRPLPGDDGGALLAIARSHAAAAAPHEIEAAYPLTPLQAQMVAELVREPQPGLDVVHLVIELTDPDLDVGALSLAWQTVVDRHAHLRVSILWEGVARPLQVVHQSVAARIIELDWRGASEPERARLCAEYVDAMRTAGFSLGAPPLYHLALARTGGDTVRLLWCYSYLLQDGWSRELLLRELLEAYDAHVAGQPLAWPPPVPHEAYVRWLEQQDEAEARRFWARELRGFSERTPLPLARSRAPRSTEPPCAAIDAALPDRIAQRVAALQRTHQLTLNTIVHGAWAALLARHARTSDVVFGTMVSDRPAALPDVETIQGTFLNILPARIRLDRAESVASWLHRLQAQQVELREYGYSAPVAPDLPPGEPLFDSYVVVQNLPIDQTMRARMRRWRASIDGLVQTRHPLALMVFPGAATSVSVTYHPSHYTAADAERLLAELIAILGALGDPAATVGDVLACTPPRSLPAPLPAAPAPPRREDPP